MQSTRTLPMPWARAPSARRVVSCLPRVTEAVFGLFFQSTSGRQFPCYSPSRLTAGHAHTQLCIERSHG